MRECPERDQINKHAKCLAGAMVTAIIDADLQLNLISQMQKRISVEPYELG
jgi:hypothetical protein